MAGFDLYFPLEHLKAALAVSLLSVCVLVGVFAYLNHFTQRRYFSIWTVGWLFYALWIVLHISSVDSLNVRLIEMAMNWAISICAVFLLWGSAGFMGEKVNEVRLALFIVFLMVWGGISAYEYKSEFFNQAVIFGFAGVIGLQTGLLYLDHRRKEGFLGAGLLSVGFFLWGLFIASYPYSRLNIHLVPAIFFISAILQLFIAVSMVILALEEMRIIQDRAFRKADAYKHETAVLRSKVESTEERYRYLFEHASEAIILVRISDRRILQMNQAARQLLVWPDTEVDFPPIEAFCPISTDSGNESGNLVTFKKMLDQGKLTLTRRDGKSIPVEAGGAEIEWGGEKALQLYFRAITEKEKLEQQLRQAEKLSALGHMISGVAHELNNPLAVVRGYLELILQHHDLPEKTRKDLEKVAYESNRAAKLVSNFLSFAREQPAHREKVQVNDILNRIVDVRRFDLKLSNIEIELELDADLPTTNADMDQLQQVFVNLIENALQVLKAQKGDRDKRLRIVTLKENQYVVVQIEDNGPGIDEKVAPHIFEPFFTTKEVGSGTGLGLSIAYSIISDHEGRIFYYPVETGGAGFRLEIPITDAEKSKQGLIKKDVEGLDKEFVHDGGRILVLDDEIMIAQLLGEILSTLGYEPSVSGHPNEALTLVQSGSFDLIVSDFRMPQMDGRGFYEELVKLRPEFRDRVIFITGDVVNEETQAFLHSLPNPSLAKPFRIKEVEEIVGLVIQRLKRGG